jgi:hypothetical protein
LNYRRPEVYLGIVLIVACCYVFFADSLPGSLRGGALPRGQARVLKAQIDSTFGPPGTLSSEGLIQDVITHIGGKPADLSSGYLKLEINQFATEWRRVAGADTVWMRTR